MGNSNNKRITIDDLLLSDQTDAFSKDFIKFWNRHKTIIHQSDPALNYNRFLDYFSIQPGDYINLPQHSFFIPRIFGTITYEPSNNWPYRETVSIEKALNSTSEDKRIKDLISTINKVNNHTTDQDGYEVGCKNHNIQVGKFYAFNKYAVYIGFMRNFLACFRRQKNRDPNGVINALSFVSSIMSVAAGSK